MPDITMCQGKNCKKKKTCHRYTAKPHKWQSYFDGEPNNEDGTCDYYWPTEDTEEANETT